MLAQIEAKIADIDDRYYRFVHQQRSFAEALTHARANVFPVEPVKTLNEVSDFLNHGKLERSNDIRIVENFLLICDDLEGVRKDVKRHLIDCLEINNELKNLRQMKSLLHCMKKWRKMLDPEFDFSELRATWPHYVVQKLSSVEAMELYAGVVSLLPILIDNMKLAFGFLKDVDKKSVWDKTALMQDKSYEPFSSRTNASALSKSVVSSRPPTGLQNGDHGQDQVQIDEEKSSRPISKISGSRKSSAKGSLKSVTVSRKNSASSRGSFVRSKTASSIRSNLRSSVASQETTGSGDKLVRPKSTPGSKIGDLENVEIIDEDGITHGQVDVRTPKQSRGVSRKSSARKSAPVARTPLSTIRQKLLSNPSDISAIQEKLRSLYCTSANSISIPDYGVKVVAKTPPRTVIADRSGTNSARSQRLTPIRPPQNSASRLEKSSCHSQELDILRRSDSATKISGGLSRVPEQSIPVLGTKKELTEITPRSDRKSNRRTTAASSRQLSNLLGYDMVSRHENAKSIITEESDTKDDDKNDDESESRLMSVVPSLTKLSLKDRELISPLSNLSQTTHKLTIPRSRGTDKLWQP